MKKFVSVFLFLTVAGASWAQELKLATVDMDRVILECEAGKAMKVDMESIFEKVRGELSAVEEKLKGLQTQLSSPSLAEDKKAELVSQFERYKIELTRMREDKIAEIKTKETEGLQKIEDELVPVMSKLTKDEGIHMLFSVNMDGLAWASDSIDVTEKVIAAYNASRK